MPICKKCKKEFPETKLIKGYCNGCIEDIKDTKIPIKNVTSSVVEVVDESSRYGTSTFLGSFIAFWGWVSIVVGFLLIFTMLLRINTIMMFLPSGIPFIIGGFASVAVGQGLKATIENTNNSRQIITELKKLNNSNRQ